MLRKGQLIWVSLDGIGSEQQGARPCVVVQNNTGNRYSRTTIVVPITTRKIKKPLPTHVFVAAEHLGEEEQDSFVLTEQVRIIDKSRILMVSHRFLPEILLQEIDQKLLTALAIKKA